MSFAWEARGAEGAAGNSGSLTGDAHLSDPEDPVLGV